MPQRLPLCTRLVHRRDPMISDAMLGSPRPLPPGLLTQFLAELPQRSVHGKEGTQVFALSRAALRAGFKITYSVFCGGINVLVPDPANRLQEVIQREKPFIGIGGHAFENRRFQIGIDVFVEP